MSKFPTGSCRSCAMRASKSTWRWLVTAVNAFSCCAVMACMIVLKFNCPGSVGWPLIASACAGGATSTASGGATSTGSGAAGGVGSVGSISTTGTSAGVAGSVAPVPNGAGGVGRPDHGCCDEELPPGVASLSQDPPLLSQDPPRLQRASALPQLSPVLQLARCR